MCKELSSLQMYEDFLKFCGKRKIKLVPWQKAIALLIYSAPLGAGKTYLIRVLRDFEGL